MPYYTYYPYLLSNPETKQRGVTSFLAQSNRFLKLNLMTPKNNYQLDDNTQRIRQHGIPARQSDHMYNNKTPKTVYGCKLIG